MWLDFSEISSAKAPSQDTEAFEKFAKQFFEELYNGTIEKTAGRGADGRVDIIVNIDDKRWLVSCKHYLNASVTASHEEDPRGRLDTHGCTKFVGFYTGSPNNSLNKFLEGIRTNYPSFDFEIFNNQDIELKLFSFANVRGWLLAARWFPASYAKVFSQLVHPLSSFSEKDIFVHSEAGKLWAGNAPFSVMFEPGNDSSQEQAKKVALFTANEIATSQAFAGIFLNRVAEFAVLFPNSFLKTRYIPDDEQFCSTIFPSWDFRILQEQVLNRRNLQGAFAICRVWSLWNPNTAMEHMRAARMLVDIHSAIQDNIVSPSDVIELYDGLYGVDASKTAHPEVDEKLTLSEIAAECCTLERGYYAGLLCFSPQRLRKGPDKDSMAVHLANQFGETKKLEERLLKITSVLSPTDQLYVKEKSGTLTELLKSIRLIDCVEEKYSGTIETGLRCFSDSGLEPWTPKASMSPELAKIFTGIST